MHLTKAAIPGVQGQQRHAQGAGGAEIEEGLAMSMNRAKIMIVDDEPEVRVVVAEFLEDFGYQVIQVGSPLQALSILRANPGVQLLITDIRMPEMSGIELADRATAQNPQLKVILISGYFVAQQMHRRSLRSPFRLKELEAAVRAQLSEARAEHYVTLI
jgi:CheY-like chemotaxis protein